MAPEEVVTLGFGVDPRDVAERDRFREFARQYNRKAQHMKNKTEKPTMPPPRIDVIELATKKVIHSVQLTNKHPRTVERVMSGMLRNMDTDRFVIEEVLS